MEFLRMFGMFFTMTAVGMMLFMVMMEAIL